MKPTSKNLTKTKTGQKLKDLQSFWFSLYLDRNTIIRKPKGLGYKNNSRERNTIREQIPS